MLAASEAVAWIVLGAIVGGFGVALLNRLAARPLAPAPADTPARVDKRVSDKQHAASKRTAAAMNGRRFRCEACGLETTGGPMTRHQEATGHKGRLSA